MQNHKLHEFVFKKKYCAPDVQYMRDSFSFCIYIPWHWSIYNVNTMFFMLGHRTVAHSLRHVGIALTCHSPT